MEASKKKFVIIDAMAIAYKAYFAFINRPLRTKNGFPTSAIYGFLTQLIKIIEDTKPDYLAIATDSKEKTFRHEKYELYKSSRAEMPEELIPQIEKLYEIIKLLQIPLIIKPGYEADDIIGTALRMAESKGFLSYAVTPDKDYVQLVTENAFLIKPGKSTDVIDIIDIPKVKELYGFEPKLMVDYLALVGDSSDDIPGVAGIGPKTATPLIQEFGSLENIYENIEKISKKGTVKKLIENKENAFLSKELATIITDAPIEIDFEKAKFTAPDFNKIAKFFEELEFKNLLAKLANAFNNENKITFSSEVKTFDKNKCSYILITTIDEAEKLANKLKEEEVFVFDTETNSLNPYEAKIIGASFCMKEGEAYFIPVNPFNTDNDMFNNNLNNRIKVSEFVNLFKNIFEDKNIGKVCQNAKYDVAVLRNIGIMVENIAFDTMLASYLIDPDEKHNMDDLSEKYLNYRPISISTLLEDKKDATKLIDCDLNDLSNYACEDADITYRLYKIFKGKLQEAGLTKLAAEVEFPLVKVLEDMERTGVNLDTKSLKQFSNELEFELNKLTEQIYKFAGEDFNINSPKQLQVILFEKLGLKGTKKTKTGYSTNAQALESLRGKHDIIDLILYYRQLAKLKSTYADSLPSLINPKTGRLHTTFNQTVAATGRLSSINPNLQNIPIRTEKGKEIRKAFSAKDTNHKILSADYSQIELRIMASICNEENLIKAFQNGEDIHSSTASKVFMVPLEDVDSDMRRKAKEVNFGILYGIGAFGLKNRLGITQTHAKEIIETYFSTFPKIKDYMNNSIEKAREKGYASTLLGRRRFLKNINSKNRIVRQFEERVAINMPIQGTAADIIKLAMIDIFKKLNKKKLKTKMLLQVHDELVFEVPVNELDEAKNLIKDSMENIFKLEVPLLVDCGIGDNWLEAH